MSAQELWKDYGRFLISAAHRSGVKSVAELGGGANPILADTDTWSFVQERVVIDISAAEIEKAEIEKAGGNIETRVADLCQPITDGLESYDMVFSKFLCEHLPDARLFHQNCYNLLRPGGIAVHMFPTLHTVPFVVNRLIPEDLSRSILERISPIRKTSPKNVKFPAYYDWCSGPTRKMLGRFSSVGFEVVEWRGAFGHNYYERIPALDAAERAKTRFLLRHPVPYMTSFAAVMLRKPD